MNTISIGTDDGGIKEIRSNDINFVPHIGDEVEIFETENKIIVSKIEKKTNPGDGININIQNSANNSGNAYTANGKKAVNKVTYCLLAFFLGSIGVHKFYAGKTGTGVLFIVFCWTFIPSLIDLIVALCQKADANGMILV